MQQQVYDKKIKEIQNTTVPAEIVGKAGDVCFWVRAYKHLHVTYMFHSIKQLRSAEIRLNVLAHSTTAWCTAVA